MHGVAVGQLRRSSGKFGTGTHVVTVVVNDVTDTAPLYGPGSGQRGLEAEGGVFLDLLKFEWVDSCDFWPWLADRKFHWSNDL